jgi:hypothetical protein
MDDGLSWSLEVKQIFEFGKQEIDQNCEIAKYEINSISKEEIAEVSNVKSNQKKINNR